jgi:hypothetical protein
MTATRNASSLTAVQRLEAALVRVASPDLARQTDADRPQERGSTPPQYRILR